MEVMELKESERVVLKAIQNEFFSDKWEIETINGQTNSKETLLGVNIILRLKDNS
jgi:hypothetical protein